MSALVASLVGLALVAWLARGLFLGYPKAALAARVLSAKEQAIVAACADAFFPPSGPISLSGTDAGLVRYMDEHVAELPAEQRALVKLLFFFLEHGTWIFGPRRARFTRLAPRDRTRALESMATSGVYFRRVAFLSMRTMLTMGYLANATVAREMGMEHRASPFEAKEVAA